MIALALGDREQPGLGAGAGMGVDRAPVGDDKALGAERLQPDVIGARRRPRPRSERSSSCSKTVNRMFCSSMVSASNLFRKVVIGGSSSLRPLASVSFRPVASSNLSSEQPSTLPRASSM